MSLESINQKLRRLEKGSPWKLLLCCGLLPALFSVAIVPLLNPTYMAHYDNPMAQILVIMLLILGFMTMYLVLVAGGIVVGIMITWLLIKFRDSFHYNSGKVIGKSLSTNDEFLRDLAKGLNVHLKQLRTDDVDLKTDELDAKYKNLIQEL